MKRCFSNVVSMTKNLALIRRSNNRQRVTRPSGSRTGSCSSDNASEDSDAVGEKRKPGSKLFLGLAPDRSWTPTKSTVFKILVSLRMSAGIWSPISDCDEVYNYWEPLHLMLYGSGFQTWEYSPVYAIRSYAYVLLHSLPLAPFQSLLPHTKVTTFFFLRCFLGFTEALADLCLYSAVCNRFGNGVGRYYVLLSTCGTGMFVASCAFLPSSFSMTLNILALSAWLYGWHFASVALTAVSALVGWPFAAVLGLPVVLSMLVEKPRQISRFAVYAASSGVSVCAILIAVDSHFYGKKVLAPLNIIVYNILSGHGPNLYGTAPVSYYLTNCFLNWNIVFPLALFALPLFHFSFKYCMERTDWSNATPLLYVQASQFLWMLIFFSQPHKEERFLFPIYPLLAVSAATALHAIERMALKLWLKRPNLAYGTLGSLLTVFCLLSASRTIALYKNYHAPADSYMALNERMLEGGRAGALPSEVTVCTGKEWYRFPSSFFLPVAVNGSRVRLEFIKSEFRGLLPKHYESVPLPLSTRLIPDFMNDMNKEEPTRYVQIEDCHYLVDLETPDTAETEPNYAAMTDKWKVVHSEPFLVAAHSQPLLRAFYVPLVSDKFSLFGRYNVLERIRN